MKRLFAVLLALLLLTGCAKPLSGMESPTQVNTTEAPPIGTIPPDGNPEDVTCKGSYTRQGNPDTIVARSGEEGLTNGELAVWYWAEASGFRQDDGPDPSLPLDQQACPLDSSVASWQQYFLKLALNAWHTAAALNQQSRDVPTPTEEAYQPNLDNYAEYMDGMPATKFLYGYNRYYTPNTMHQAYLDALPDTLSEMAKEKGWADVSELARGAFGASTAELTQMAQNLNRAYMYFTELTYSLTQAEETEDDLNGEYYVNIRHILLQGGEDALKQFQSEAKQRMKPLTQGEKYSESMFADLAHTYSQDSGTAVDGGVYRRVQKGQLPQQMDAWCFDPARQPGDTTILSDQDQVHILYFSGKESVTHAEAADASLREQQLALIAAAREEYPMEVTYEGISLPEAQGGVSAGELLYPDIAHERFPEVPLYLQQDYPGTMFGGFPIRTNGCGITSMAMLASYLADELLTPPEMCRRYGSYSHRNGTDGMIFVKEPPVMGFYLVEKTYEPTVAWQGLEQGHVVISIQHKGYWTRGGHYIVLEKLTEDGQVQVRDSNIYNYNRVPAHINDKHTWGSITSAGSGYWIFDYKVTKVPSCPRCGNPQEAQGQLVSENYYCQRCAKALLRRNTYLMSAE